MKYKAIDSISVRKTRKKGKILKVVDELPQDLIIFDAYIDKEYLGRYAINHETGEYACKINDVWHTRKLEAFLQETRYEYYYMPQLKGWSFENETQHMLVSQILNPQEGEDYMESFNGIISSIESKEFHYCLEKRRDAYDRKVIRVKELMNKVPDIPDDFDTWWYGTCEDVRDVDYMFYDKESDSYKCTACGKIHRIKNKLKHRQDYTCSRTGKTVTVLRRQKFVCHYDHAMLLSAVDDNWTAERLFNVETVWDGCRKYICLEEVIRIMLSRTGKKTKIYYSQCINDYFNITHVRHNSGSNWWDSNPCNKRMRDAYLYPPDIECIRGTQIENLKIAQMAAVGAKLNWNGIIYYSDFVQCFEYILKIGLKRLAKEESDKLDVWRGYSTYEGGIHTTINLEGRTAEEVLGINKQRINRLREVNGGSLTLGWMTVEEATGKKISTAALVSAEKYEINAENYNFIYDRMSPEQVINYVAKQIEEGMKGYRIYSYWQDYLAMAARVGMDLTDSIVYKPKDLRKRHDELVEEITRLGDTEWVCQVMLKYPNIDSICRSIKDKYEYENDTYKMMVPEGIKDIVDDGNQLHHCSASSERYFDRINKKECYLLFLRKKEDLKKAWYTVEIQPDGTVRQKRTAYNRQDDIEEVMKFIREWQKAIKKRLTEEDIELGRQSEIQREIEQMELLQKGDEKSLRVYEELENDFLRNDIAPALLESAV